MVGKINNFYYTKTILAKNDFEKVSNKLLNNSFFGKTMEHVRNRRNVDFFEEDDNERTIK